MDGVLDMVPFCRKGGFELLHRDLRWEGVAAGGGNAAAVPLERVDFPRLEAYDRLHVEAPRADFLRAWLGQPGGLGAAVVDAAGALRGYGFLRPCRQGFKVGPAFADDGAWAGPSPSPVRAWSTARGPRCPWRGSSGVTSFEFG